LKRKTTIRLRHFFNVESGRVEALRIAV